MGRKEMFRDFSDEAKQKLLKYVDEVTADGTWDRVKDWFGDAGLTIQSWLGQLSIQNYVNDVDTYHKKVLDKNNTTAKQIGEIFSNVQAVDTRYLSIAGSEAACGDDIIKLIRDLASAIDPNGGNMDMGRMKGVLDADVENIRNARATAERAVEEKMLGTEAEGCMNSEDPVSYTHLDVYKRQGTATDNGAGISFPQSGGFTGNGDVHTATITLSLIHI